MLPSPSDSPFTSGPNLQNHDILSVFLEHAPMPANPYLLHPPHSVCDKVCAASVTVLPFYAGISETQRSSEPGGVFRPFYDSVTLRPSPLAVSRQNHNHFTQLALPTSNPAAPRAACFPCPCFGGILVGFFSPPFPYPDAVPHTARGGGSAPPQQRPLGGGGKEGAGVA